MPVDLNFFRVNFGPISTFFDFFVANRVKFTSVVRKECSVNCVLLRVVLCQLLICAGDVETNPGPDNDTELNIKDLLEQQQVSLKTFFDQQLIAQFRTFESQISAALHTSIATVSKELQALNDRTSRLEDYCYSAICEAQDAKYQVQELSDRLNSVVRNFEDKIDRIEAYSRRDNLRFFNIPQTHEESYEECTRTALGILKDAMPEINWHQDDIARAHRIGRYNANQTRPKPLIVKFSRWSDKIMVLTRGKESLRKKGIAVAGDLTDRQRQTIEEHRQQGLHAYYRGNRLIVVGPLRNRSNRSNYNRHDTTEVRDRPNKQQEMDRHNHYNSRRRGNDEYVHSENQWQRDDYQPWSTHHFPSLPQRQVNRLDAPTASPYDGTSSERSPRPRKTTATTTGDEESRGIVGSTPTLPVEDSPSFSRDQTTLPQTPSGSSENSQQDPQPLDNVQPESTPSPHCPQIPQTTDDTDDQDSQHHQESAKVDSTISDPAAQQTPSEQDPEIVFPVDTEVNVTLPGSTAESSHVRSADQNVGQKRSRCLRSASVTSTDGKRQTTITETVSKSGDKQHVKSKSVNK